jgi:hypothetical protein
MRIRALFKGLIGMTGKVTPVFGTGVASFPQSTAKMLFVAAKPAWRYATKKKIVKKLFKEVKGIFYYCF